ncbi:MAG: sel1 repeat family protein [Kiritimatiellae bacterium]|nr:sel1 repeat family protein [Kiritimatiellia bacterium]
MSFSLCVRTASAASPVVAVCLGVLAATGPLADSGLAADLPWEKEQAQTPAPGTGAEGVQLPWEKETAGPKKAPRTQEPESGPLPWEQQKKAPAPAPAKPAVKPKAEEAKLADLRRRAEAGEAGAQFSYGLRFAQGKGVTLDYAAAKMWFERAAAQGHASARFNLGVIYKDGLGVAQDYAKAIAQFGAVLKAELGRSNWEVAVAKTKAGLEAQRMLGICYHYGPESLRDDKKAYHWFWLAGGAGNHGPAQNNLGLCYANGWGVEKSAKDAAYWYERGARNGDKLAAYNLARAYERGEGVAKDRAKAVEWYEVALKKGYERAKTRLEKLK